MIATIPPLYGGEGAICCMADTIAHVIDDHAEDWSSDSHFGARRSRGRGSSHSSRSDITLTKELLAERAKEEEQDDVVDDETVMTTQPPIITTTLSQPRTTCFLGYNWNELNINQEGRSELLLHVVLPVTCLLMLGLLVLLAYWRCSSPKLSLAQIIALDLQDTESSAEFLSSLTGHGERHTSTSSDMSDSVFVMVYLPPPYEETLTKITRAASLTSRKESMKIEDLEAWLCPEIKSSGRYV